MALILQAIANYGTDGVQTSIPEGILTHASIFTDSQDWHFADTHLELDITDGVSLQFGRIHHITSGYLDYTTSLEWNGTLEIAEPRFIRLRRTGYWNARIYATYKILTQLYDGPTSRFIENAIRRGTIR